MHNIENIREIFKSYGGMMRTQDLSDEKLYYYNIQKLLNDGLIEKVRFGYYRWVDIENSSNEDIIVKLFPDAVICMDSALYHYGYIEFEPNEWHLAVDKDSGKSRFNLDYPAVKPYFIEQKYLKIGLTQANINGTDVKIYDRERLICDCLRYRNKMDREIFNSAIRAYVADPQKNIAHLNEYSAELRVSKTARDLLGIWL